MIQVLCKVRLPQIEGLEWATWYKVFLLSGATVTLESVQMRSLCGSIWSLLSIAFIDLFPQIGHIHIKEYQP